MTEERLERYRINSEHLNRVILWSIENRERWFSLCFDDENGGMATHTIDCLLDETFQKGFMELYYLLLVKIADMLQIDGDPKRFLPFLLAAAHRGLTLDVVPIQAALDALQLARRNEALEHGILEEELEE